MYFETDGTSLLRDRVGGTLKNGFQLAGRRFEFLAYSSSALREHAVWFLSPFQHPKYGWVDAASIRRRLGTFTSVSKSPSKLAARMAQAFTATDPSVEITVGQWEIVEDLGEGSYLHTDGVGTISKQLGDMIWDALCESKDPYYKKISVKPSAVSWIFSLKLATFSQLLLVPDPFSRYVDYLVACKFPALRSMGRLQGNGVC
jgi:RNA-dependent RNA polymerase